MSWKTGTARTTSSSTAKGKGGELTTNRREDQEMGLLCLHLLQSSLVFVNTLMIQRILTDPAWTT